MPETIIEYLHQQVAVKPDEVAFRFLPSKTEPLIELTYRELWFEALSVANFLKSKTQTGDKVLLMYPPNLEYVVAFYGCFMAGVIAVPTPLPKNNMAPIIKVVNQSKPVLVLTTLREVSAIKAFWKEQGDLLKTISIFTSENSVSLFGKLESSIEVSPKTPAFLHYFFDSNNMNEEKSITHSDIIDNVRKRPLMSEEKAHDVFISWLPFINEVESAEIC